MIAVGVLWLGLAWALDRRGHVQPPAGTRFDAIVVLGCPGPQALARRVALAARLFHLGHAPRVVTTGGVTRGSEAEAVIAARGLARLGVPVEAIVVEDRSLTTLENARFSRALVAGASSVLLVSDTFHLPRARILFGRHFDHVAVAGTEGSLRARARGALREVPTFVLYAALG